MTCPRCGAPNPPYARQCGRCGLIFGPESVPQSRPRNSRPQTDAPAQSGFWDPEMPGQAMNPGMSGQWNAPSDGLGSGGLPPGMGLMSPPSNPQRAMMSGTSGLFPGAVLMGGRLRVLGVYGTSTQTQMSPGRQWVAVDANRRGDRVALLELPLGGMSPADADRARLMLAERLKLIGEHPSIQGVLGSFSEQGRHFIVLEHRDGAFLGDVVRRDGPLPDRVALGFGLQILGVLEHLALQIPVMVHGAIGPDSVLLEPDGSTAWVLTCSPYVVARLLQVPLVGQPPPSTGYTPPDQSRGQYEPRADLYSLGATLYFAMTGVESAVRGGGIFSPARQINQSISPPAEAVLAKSVRLVSSQRYQYPDEMRLDIERARRGESPTRDAVSMLKPIFGADRPMRISPLAVLGIVSAALALIVVAVFVLRGPSSANVGNLVAPTATINPTQVALLKQNIGLSTGTFIFDRVALEGSSSSQATPAPTATAQITDQTPAGAIAAELAGAAALRANDLPTALTNFRQAVRDDPNNAEARIYLANALLLSNKTKNFVTIDVAVSFADQDLETSRDVLRGVSLAQSSLNSSGQLPGGGQVRIEIASVGASTEGAPLLAQYLLQQNNPNHSIGVISWASRFVTPDSLKPLAAALQQLAAADVPVIAPVVTTDQLPPDPHFFQLSTSDQYQGGVMAGVVMGAPFYASRVMIAIDPSNISNQEVGGTAAVLLKQQLGDGAVFQDTIDGSDASITQVVHDARFNGAEVILLASDGDNAVKLAGAVAQSGSVIPIVTGANADSPTLIGQGDSPLASVARDNPQAMQLLSVVSFADPGQWDFVKAQNLPNFVGAPGFFGNFSDAYPAIEQADANAIFSYDAVDIMVKSVAKGGAWTDTHLPTSSDTRVALSNVNAQNPFMGISGRIAFNDKGVPTPRALVVKSVEITKQTNASGNRLLGWKFVTIVGGINAFCANAACTPD